MDLSQNKRGMLYMFIASFLFAVVSLCVKKLSVHLTSIEMVFFRNIAITILLLVSFYKIPTIKKEGKRPFLLIFRGLVGFSALMMFFYNLSTLSLAEATIFSRTSSIFTPLLAFFIFKEMMSKISWVALGIGFVGIIFITGFDVSSLSKSDYLGVISGLLAGIAHTCIKELRNYYDSRLIILTFTTIGTVLPISFMVIAEFIPADSFYAQTFDFVIAPFVLPRGIEWLYILVMGFSATAAQVLMTKAYGYSKAGILSTISYFNVFFAFILGFIIGDAFPDDMVFIGILLIVFSGIIVAMKRS